MSLQFQTCQFAVQKHSLSSKLSAVGRCYHFSFCPCLLQYELKFKVLYFPCQLSLCFTSLLPKRSWFHYSILYQDNSSGLRVKYLKVALLIQRLYDWLNWAPQTNSFNSTLLYNIKAQTALLSLTRLQCHLDAAFPFLLLSSNHSILYLSGCYYCFK